MIALVPAALTIGSSFAGGVGDARADVVLDPGFSSETVAAGEYAPGQTTDFLIREGYGQRSGSNLFHRFSQFDLDAGESATFVEDTPGSGITRVFSHVNGGTSSYIDGTIRSTIAGANLFFFNPRGIVWGPNARLDVLGAFHASSADRIRLADGTLFGDAGGAPSVSITSAAPAAWGFLSAAPESLAVQGAQLGVDAGQTLSLIGGDLEIEGNGSPPTLPNPGPPTLAAPSGRIELVSVASAGEVPIRTGAGAGAPDLDDFESLGSLRLSDGALLDVSGAQSESILLRGDSITLDDGSLRANHSGPTDHGGIAIDLEARGTVRLGDSTAGGRVVHLDARVLRSPGQTNSEQGGDGGRVRLDAQDLRLEGELGQGGRTLIQVGSACTSSCGPGSQTTGQGGALEIAADTVDLRNGAWITSESGGPGRGADIGIDARTVSIGNDVGAAPGTSTFIGSASLGTVVGAPVGNQDAAGGEIRIDATEHIALDNGGQISTFGSGTGKSGDIDLRTARFEIRRTDPAVGANGRPSGSRSIIATQHDGASDAGAIRIDATESIGVTFGEVFTRILGSGPGRPGAVSLRAPGGEVRVERGSAFTVWSRDGAGRDLDVEADRLVVRDNSIIQSFSGGSGQAGDINVRVRDVLLSGGNGALTPAGFVSRPIGSMTTGTGAGGTVRIDGERLRLEDGALILLSSREQGAAGDLIVGGEAPLASVELDASSIETNNVAVGATGGRVEIHADRIALTNGARISAVNRDLALPGRIELEGDDLLVDSGSVITSASDGPTGVGGDIVVRMRDTTVIENAQLTTDAAGADNVNQGGNIDLSSEVLILAASTLEADAPAGAGGNVRIVAGRFVQTNDSRISATGSSPDLAGSVRVIASDTNAVETVAREPRMIEDAARRLATGCDVRTDAQGSLFVLPRPTLAPPGEDLGGSPLRAATAPPLSRSLALESGVTAGERLLSERPSCGRI